jgi:hypothetical protein
MKLTELLKDSRRLQGSHQAGILPDGERELICGHHFMIKNGKLFAIHFCLFLLITGIVSCTGNSLTDDEKKQTEQYTKQEKHDSLLFGKWQSHETFALSQKGEIGRYLISFDSTGIIRNRHYAGTKPRHDWALEFYYYTKNDTIFRYRPAEKGFMAMNGEINLKHPYEINQEGNLLIIEGKRYTKVKDVDVSF